MAARTEVKYQSNNPKVVGMVGKAAEAARIDRDYHYYWLRSDENYIAAFDNLAMAFLKGVRPERYRDNQAGIALQGPTQINITIKQR